MTYAAVGSIQFNTGSPVPSLSLTTTTAGNFVLAEVVNTGTATATALSSSNCTWSALGTPFTGSVTAGTCQCFLGVVTGTGAASVAVTWGAGTTNVFSGLVAQEFSTTTGTPVLDKQGHVDSAGVSTWASLSPAGPGECYFGYALNAGSATNGSTSGYVYGNDGSGNGVAHNPACGGSATAPVWGDSGQQLGVMVLVMPAGGAAAAAAAAPAAQPGKTWLRRFSHRLQVPPPPPVTVTTATANLAAAGTVTAAATQDAGTATNLAGAGTVTAAATQAVTASLAGAGTMTANAGTMTAAPPVPPQPAQPGKTWLRRFRHRQAPRATSPAPPKLYLTSVQGTGTAQYFADQNGAPWLCRGDSIWGLVANAGYAGAPTTPQTDIDLYMSTRASQGFNAALVDCVTTTGEGLSNVNANGNTWDGVAPFTGSPGTLNNSYWARVDYAVTSAAANGITVFLVLADKYSLGNAGAALNGMTTGQATTYGTALAARYAAAPNIVWLFGNDYNDEFGSVYDNILTALRAGGDTHLVTVENLTEGDSRFSDLAGTAYTWGTAHAQFNFVYTYGGCYPCLNYAYAESSPLAVLLGDGWYDGTGFGTAPAATRDFMRLLVWWSLSSGSRGYMYGDQSLISWNPNTSLGTVPFAATDLNNILDAYTSWAGWHQLVPDAGNVLVTGHRGTNLGLFTSNTSNAYSGLSGGLGGARNYYVTASITADKSLAVLYLPDATGTQNGGAVTIDQSQLPSGYTATWVDPATGAQTPTATGSSYSNGTANSQGGADWVLILQAPPLAAATANLAGAGAVTAKATVIAPATVAAAGQVADVATQAVTASLAGAGTVVPVPVTGAAVATPAGAGSAAAVVTEAVTAPLAGAGVITGVVTQAVTAAPAGAGAVTATGTSGGAATANLAGAGSVTAAAVQGAIAAPAGAGSAAAAVTEAVTANLAGAGAVTATGTSSGAATASPAGAGTVTAAVTQAVTATAAAAGTVTAAAAQRGAASLTAAGTVNAAGQITGTANLAAAGAVTAKAAQAATAAAAAASALSAVATQAATAALTAAGAVTAGSAVQAPVVFGTSTVDGRPLATSTAAGGAPTTSTVGGQP